MTPILWLTIMAIMVLLVIFVLAIVHRNNLKRRLANSSEEADINPVQLARMARQARACGVEISPETLEKIDKRAEKYKKRK